MEVELEPAGAGGRVRGDDRVRALVALAGGFREPQPQPVGRVHLVALQQSVEVDAQAQEVLRHLLPLQHAQTQVGAAPGVDDRAAHAAPGRAETWRGRRVVE